MRRMQYDNRDDTTPPRPLPTRFWEKVDASGDCWVWLGGRTLGYGRFSWVHGRSRMAHRLTWEALVGPIPEGLEMDHLCMNKACVNPDHLEPVTHAENMRRGHTGTKHWNGRKTHCPNGHPYDESNTYQRPSNRRGCRACQRVALRKWRERQRRPKGET